MPVEYNLRNGISVISFEKSSPTGLNGFILLMHIGSDPRRKDKFYLFFPLLIDKLLEMGYQLISINELLKE